MKRLMPLAASLLLACQAAPPPVPPAAPPPPDEPGLDTPDPSSLPEAPSFAGPTIALSAPLDQALEALMAHERITSANIGLGGEASETYAAYEQVVAIATDEEERALIAHTDPIVRGYLGGHLARFHAGHLGELESVLRDITLVDEQHGCMRGLRTVAAYVAQTLCNAIHLKDATAGEARLVLADLAADDTSPVQRDAQRCLDRLP